jgi:LacI family transcriptional regulator
VTGNNRKDIYGTTTTTLSDIARRARVSKMTVSRALSPKSSHLVAAPLLKRIKSLATSLGYQPNISAQALTHGKSFLIGVLHNSGNVTYIPMISRGLQGVLADGGFAPLVYAHADVQEEARFIDQCMARRVDGLIANLAFGEDGRTNVLRYAKLRDGGVPMVEINGRLVEGVPHVVADYGAAAVHLTQQLISAGHSRIALYTVDVYREHEKRPGYNWNSHAFWTGYEKTMTEAGLKPTVLTYPTRPGPRAPRSGMLATLAAGGGVKPTAFVCHAIGAAEMLSHFIFTTPSARDLAIAAFGDIRNTLFLPKGTLRLGFPAMAIGDVAAQLILKQLDDRSTEDVAIAPVPISEES